MGPQLVDYLLYEPEDSGILWIKFNRPERMTALCGMLPTLPIRMRYPGLSCVIVVVNFRMTVSGLPTTRAPTSCRPS